MGNRPRKGKKLTQEQNPGLLTHSPMPNPLDLAKKPHVKCL